MTPVAVSLAIGAVAGLVGGALVALVVKAAPRLKVLAIIAGIVVFAAVNAAGRDRILRPFQARYRRAQTEREVLAIPLYRELKRHEPGAYDELLGEIVDAVERGTPKELLGTTGREKLTPITMKYLQTASDAAVVSFGRVVLKEVTVLEAKNPETAFAFLFPRPHELLDLAALPDELRREELECTANLIRSGAAREGKSLSRDAGQALLEKVLSGLPPEVLKNVAAAANPHADGVDRPGVVKATGVFYQTVLALPPEDAAALLRFLMSA